MTHDGRPLGSSIEEFFEAMLDDYAELEPDALCNERQLIIAWGRKGRGFGLLSFFADESGVVSCDNETMGRAFCKSVLLQFCAGGSYGERLPPLLARFDKPGPPPRSNEPMIDALLDAAVLHHPTDDWGRK